MGCSTEAPLKLFSNFCYVILLINSLKDFMIRKILTFENLLISYLIAAVGGQPKVEDPGGESKP
jgi:hypothetical protein